MKLKYFSAEIEYYDLNVIVQGFCSEWSIRRIRGVSILHHWYAFCAPKKTSYRVYEGTGWRKVIDYKCIKCKKEIPGGVALLLSMNAYTMTEDIHKEWEECII